MATALQIPARTTLHQYLSTTYRPDREYIDGIVEERNVGMWPHSRLLVLIAGWFSVNERLWHVMGAISLRVQVSPTRVRVPDVVLIDTLDPPDVLIDPPLLIIEIVSPEDTYTSVEQRIADYRTMGVQNVWVVNPETRTARTIVGDTWASVTRLEIPNKAVFIDLPQIFARLDLTA